MIEIEAKFKLEATVTAADLLVQLHDAFTAPLTKKRQIDTVFLLPEQVNAPIAPGSKIMRVRDVLDPKSGELVKSLMTLKVEGQTKLVSAEYEFEVESGEVARQMLAAMGWQEVVTVDKTRIESKLGAYDVCIDEVASLGLFVELEILADDEAKTQEIQATMKDFLQNLGLDGELWDTPYDTSLRNLLQ